MSPANGHNFVEWKEQFVSQERGSRVVHYFLKDSVGDFFLAVVGTERSLRHMVYVVAEEFLQVPGFDRSSNSCVKWRSRREVVDWLTSLLSKQPHAAAASFGDFSKSSSNYPNQISDVDISVIGSDEPGRYPHNQKGGFARKLKGHNSDILWSGVAWTCGKQLKHYHSFCRNGTTIAARSFVLVMAKEDNHYLAYLEDMYEDRKGLKKVKVRWFHQNQEVAGIIPPPHPHPKEVFITPYSQAISAECVDDLATVLIPEHYKKCVGFFPVNFLARIYLCFRQFRSNRFKPFDLSKLKGYFDQKILPCIDVYPVSKHELACKNLNVEEVEEARHGGTIKRGLKKSRSCRGHQRFAAGCPSVRISNRVSQIMARLPEYKDLRFRIPGRRPLAVKHMGPTLCASPPFKIDEKIELLCQDSGIRGCWFRCTVLQVSQKQLKVHYDDVQNEDECGNLEEWVPAFRFAAPDKLGMRCSGRLTVRPCPPVEDLSDSALEVGTPVDAWCSDGWWEGVITGVDNSSDGALQAYFPGEDDFSIVRRSNLRISRDWVGSRWTDIEAKPDILSAISAVSPGTKLSTCLAAAKRADSSGSGLSDREVPSTSSEHGSIAEEDKQAPVASEGSNKLLENVKCISSRKRQRDGSQVRRDDDDDNVDDDDGGDDDGDNDDDIGNDHNDNDNDDDDDDGEDDGSGGNGGGGDNDDGDGKLDP